MRTPTPVRERPENTVGLIEVGPDDEFNEMRPSALAANEGILAGLARLLQKPVDQVKAAFSLTTKTNQPDYPVTDCRECGKEFRIFDKRYGKKQTVCPACDDEQMRAVREAAMRPERLKAQRLIQLQEQAEAKKKSESQRETIELVAQTVAQVLAENKSKA